MVGWSGGREDGLVAGIAQLVEHNLAKVGVAGSKGGQSEARTGGQNNS